MELNINGIMDTAYTYGNERLTNERFTGWTGYYTYDPRGSVSGITDSEGMIWQSYRYDGYGNITFGKPEYNNVYAYNAESYNPNVDVQYLRARYYCPTTADFLTEDSYLGNISDPLTLNRYNYVKSSPLNYVDPSGHLPITPDAAFDAVSWLLSATEFMMAPSVSTGLSLAWDTFAVLAPGVPSVGLMDEMAEFTIKETGETITKKAFMEAAEEATERVARDGLEAGMKYADELGQASKCADVDDIEHLLLNINESGSSSTLKINELPLAKPGEDLYVGTYSKSSYWNKKTGLNKTHTPHHAVQDAVSSVSHGKGITINIRKDIHLDTETYGSLRTGLTNRQHLAADVAELRVLLKEQGYSRSTINAQLNELIKQNKALGGFEK